MRFGEDWSRASDLVIEDLLSTHAILAPPVDALQLARDMQMSLAWDAGQAGRGRLVRRGSQTTILLKPDDRPERLQWAAAHEIGESVVWRVCQSLGFDGDEVLPRQREQLANGLAQRLLLPTAWFQASVAESEGDLFSLKARFPTASHELICWRMLDLKTPRIITIWDDGKETRRRSNLPGRLCPVSRMESRLWSSLYAGETPACEEFTDQGRIRGWALHEPGWRREIVSWEVRLEEPEDADWQD